MGEGHDRPGLEVPGAAHHRDGLTTGRDGAHSHLVGVGMRRHLQHASDVDLRPARFQRLHPFDLVAEHGQGAPQLGNVAGGEGDEFRQPVERDLHLAPHRPWAAEEAGTAVREWSCRLGGAVTGTAPGSAGRSR